MDLAHPSRLDEYRGTDETARATRLEAEAYALRSQVENLEAALRNARMIGAAVGILMAAEKLPYDDAFDLLSRASQRHNVKLRDLADRVVFTGAM